MLDRLLLKLRLGFLLFVVALLQADWLEEVWQLLGLVPQFAK